MFKQSLTGTVVPHHGISPGQVKERTETYEESHDCRERGIRSVLKSTKRQKRLTAGFNSPVASSRETRNVQLSV